MADTPQLANGAIDPNVRIPDSVTSASSAADKLHEQFYPKDPNQLPAANKEAIPQPPDPAIAAAAAAQAEVDRVAAEKAAAQAQTQVDPALANQTPAPGDDDGTWKHKFLTMQGRFTAQQKNIAGLEQTMRDMAKELVASQQLLQQQPANQHQTEGTRANPDHNKLITSEDRETYGDDLVNFTQRAALAAVSPAIQALTDENNRLKKTVNTSVKRTMFDQVTERIPNWRDINKDSRWLGWLTLPNIYTGQIRQQVLDNAIAAADAPKVVQLFKDFLAEANATGQTFQSPQHEQRDTSQPAPRIAAVDLATLAAPGKAHPAPGNQSPAPNAKPFITRAEISQFYNDSRRGLYAGREAEYRQREAELQAAQSEGRIRG